MAPKSNSHISQSFVVSVYKPAFFQCYSVQFKSNFVQQCIQISTRINSSSVHTYIFICFIRNSSNNSTWCQNRGCSYISSRRRIYRSNPAVSCIFPSILNISTVELQFYYNFQGGRKTAISAKCHWIQGLQSSSTQQNLYSKWQQGSPGSPCAVQVPRVQFPVPLSILPGRNFILCGLRHPADPCGAPVLQ